MPGKMYKISRRTTRSNALSYKYHLAALAKKWYLFQNQASDPF